MAFDYSGLFDTATDLIANFGRDVTLRLRPQAPADPAKPWAAKEAADPLDVPARAAFLEPKEEDREGQNVEQLRERVLVASSSLGTNRLTHDWQVVDGTRVYEILRADPIQPGPVLLYYDLLVSL